MKVTREEILSLSKMSGLTFSEAEVVDLERDLSERLAETAILGALDIEELEPTFRVLKMRNAWREDKVEDFGVEREQLLALAAETVDGQVKVPKIL